MDGVQPWARKVLRFWEIPFLALLAGFMFWVRMLPAQALLGQGRAYYIGTDPFYHYRETLGIVRSFPNVPRFDPWTHFPHGTGTGQFGSLFDWLAAAFVVMTQGRGASEAYVAYVLGVVPAVMGALLIVPFYFLAKRLLGTPGAVVSAATLAVLPGEFLIRSIAGYADHHVAEAFFASLAILGVVVAVERAHAARARLADLRDVKAYRGPLLWGVLGGVALAANFYAWPPAILFLGILTVWLVVAILLENAREEGDARGMVFAAAVAFATTALLMLPAIETTFIGEFNTYGLLQPLACVLAAGGLVAVHAASRWCKARGLSPWVLPGALAGLSVVGFVALRFLAPVVYGSFVWGLSWITGIGVRRTTLTISEARSAEFFCTADTRAASCLANDFGVVAPFSFLILVGLLGFVLWKRRRMDILLLVWSFVIFRATATQIRFSYYLALNMALLVGWLGARVAEAAGYDRVEAVLAAPAKGARGRRTRAIAQSDRRARPWAAAAVAVAFLLVLPGNVFATEKPARATPGWESAEIRQPDGDVVLWSRGLDWLRENTPDAGVRLEEVTPRPAPGEAFDYPDESYGVLSWWDYGHWIEVFARRPPVANPFQQAAPFSSCFFTETDPARAEAFLSQWETRSFVRGDVPCEQVDATLPAADAERFPVRYLMIDDEMAAGKFGAIAVWAGCGKCGMANDTSGEDMQGLSYNERLHRIFKYWKPFRDEAGRELSLPWSGEPYRETMLSRLYHQDGNTLERYRLVHESPETVLMGSLARRNEDGGLQSLESTNSILSGRIVRDPREAAFDSGDALVATEDGQYIYDANVAAALKTYERVAGARVAGDGQPPGATVTVYVSLQSETTQRQFQWQGSASVAADGTFEVVVPYSTSEPVPVSEGGTNATVKAVGPAVVRVAGAGAPVSASVEIPDRAVLRGEDVRVSFA